MTTSSASPTVIVPSESKETLFLLNVVSAISQPAILPSSAVIVPVISASTAVNNPVVESKLNLVT
jgi:hypothetical protein